jgi:hypothetical protein
MVVWSSLLILVLVLRSAQYSGCCASAESSERTGYLALGFKIGTISSLCSTAGLDDRSSNCLLPFEHAV